MSQNKKLWFGLPALALLLMALIYFARLNQSLFYFFNAWQLAVPGVVWSYFTIYGDAAVAMAMMLLFANRYPRILWTSMIALVVGAVFTIGMKDALHILRPPGVLPLDTVHVYGPVHVYDSFPSGHTVTAWTLASILWVYLDKPWRLLPVLMAGMVGISRMAIGVHWPLDVLAGIGLGWLVGQLSVYLSRRVDIGMSPWTRGIIIMILGADSIGLFWYDNGYEQTFWMQYIIAGACVLSLILAVKTLFWQRDKNKA